MPAKEQDPKTILTPMTEKEFTRALVKLGITKNADAAIFCGTSYRNLQKRLNSGAGIPDCAAILIRLAIRAALSPAKVIELTRKPL